MRSHSRIPDNRGLFWVLLALPFAWLTVSWFDDSLTYGEVLHLSGRWAVWLMMLSMAVTPMRLLFPAASWPNWLLARRRYLGVASFAFAALHTLVYLERKRDLSLIVSEASDFAMWTGWVAFVIFIALAVTSNDASVKRLHRTWKKLHRYVYLSALLIFAHWIFSAFNYQTGLAHFVILLAIELLRLWKRGKLNLKGPK